jgi:hypothetical protein
MVTVIMGFYSCKLMPVSILLVNEVSTSVELGHGNYFLPSHLNDDKNNK